MAHSADSAPRPPSLSENFLRGFFIFCVLENGQYRVDWAHFDGLLANNLLGCALILGGVAAFLASANSRLFLAFVGVFIAKIVVEWPEVSNASLPLLVVAILILARSAAQRSPSRLSDLSAEASLLAGGIYLVSGFHKLNSGFFNPEFNCVFPFLNHALFGRGPAQPSVAISVAIVALECGLGLGWLLSRRVPLWVAWLSFGFALVLGLGIDSFPTTMIFLHVLALRVGSERCSERGAAQSSTLLRILALATLAAFYGASRHDFSYYDHRPWTRVLWATILLAGGIAAWRAKNYAALGFVGGRQPIPSRRRRVIMTGLLGLALAPYAGLRTSVALSMFSNLKVEGGSNHFLIRDTPWVKRYLADLVRLEASDFRPMSDFSSRQLYLPRVELERLVVRYQSRGLHGSLRYSEPGDGSIRSITWTDDSIAPPLRYSWFERKMLIFRPIAFDRNHCLW